MQVKRLIFRNRIINLKIIALIILLCNSITFIGQNVYTVTKTTDPDPFVYSFNNNDNLCPPELLGTLQWALRKINANVGPSIINFNIPGGGVQTIIVNYVLPGGRSNLVIDGTTQSGYSLGNPQIKLVQGPNIQNNDFIQFYNVSNVTIKGLMFIGKRGVGAEVSSNFLIKDNVFGDDVSTSDYGTRVVLFQNTNHNIITNNKFLHCGISLVGYDAQKLLGGDNLVAKNSFLNTTQSTGDGFLVEIDGSIHNKVTQNTFVNQQFYYWIFKSIDLRVGGNNLKDPPVINAISNLSNVTGSALPGDTIELFGSTGPENANEYLKTVIADVNGNWSTDLTGLKWTHVSATATDVDNNTSTIGISFSTCPALSTTVPCAPMNFAIPSGDLPAGSPVTFQNTSISCTSNYPVYWNFGDGTPVYGGGNIYSNVNPTHTYSNAGTYDVTLYALNSTGCMVQSVTKQVTIIYSAPPKLKFCSPNIACTGKQVVFENQSTGYLGNTTFTWNYGDGSTATTSTIHTYSSAGTYTVILTSPDKTISSSIDIVDDCLSPCLLVKVSSSSATICSGGSTVLTASGATTYLWNTGATTASITVTPSSTTNYTVTGNVQAGSQNLITNGDFEQGNTGFTSSRIYNENEDSYFIDNGATLCNNYFPDHTPGGNGNTFYLTFDSTLIGYNGIQQLDNFISLNISGLSQNTNYNFKFWMRRSGCTTITGTISPQSFSVNVNGQTTQLNNLPQTPDNWYQVTQTFNSGANTSATLSLIADNSLLSYSRDGVFAFDDFSIDVPVYECSATTTVTVNQPPALTSGFQAGVCSDNLFTHTLTSSTPESTFSWTRAAVTGITPSLGSGTGNVSEVLTNSTPNSINVSYLLYATANGCTGPPANGLLTVYPQPIVTVNSETICAGQTTTLTATGGLTYLWSTGETTSSIEVNPTSTTSYTVTGSNSNACSSSITSTVTVKPNPIITLNNPSFICVGGSMILYASGADNYVWSGNALSSTSGTSVIASPSVTGNYTAYGITDGCTSLQASVQIIVNQNCKYECSNTK